MAAQVPRPSRRPSLLPATAPGCRSRDLPLGEFVGGRRDSRRLRRRRGVAAHGRAVSGAGALTPAGGCRRGVAAWRLRPEEPRASPSWRQGAPAPRGKERRGRGRLGAAADSHRLRGLARRRPQKRRRQRRALKAARSRSRGWLDPRREVRTARWFARRRGRHATAGPTRRGGKGKGGRAPRGPAARPGRRPAAEEGGGGSHRPVRRQGRRLARRAQAGGTTVGSARPASCAAAVTCAGERGLEFGLPGALRLAQMASAPAKRWRGRLQGLSRLLLPRIVAQAHFASLRANDFGFDDEIVRAADHQQMFDIVAPNDHELAMPVEIEGVDDAKPRHARPAAGRRLQPASESEAKNEKDQRRRKQQSNGPGERRSRLLFSEIFSTRACMLGCARKNKDGDLLVTLSTGREQKRILPHVRKCCPSDQGSQVWRATRAGAGRSPHAIMRAFFKLRA